MGPANTEIAINARRNAKNFLRQVFMMLPPENIF